MDGRFRARDDLCLDPIDKPDDRLQLPLRAQAGLGPVEPHYIDELSLDVRDVPLLRLDIRGKPGSAVLGAPVDDVLVVNTCLRADVEGRADPQDVVVD